MTNEIAVIDAQIPFDIYQNLRIKCGLSPKSDDAAKIGITNSLYSVMLRVDNQTVGMGRIIGDGGCFCQVVDICVDPNFQGIGFGKLIMENLMMFVKNSLPKTCYLSLIADGEASFLYEKFGFKDTSPGSRGMFLKIE